MFRERIGTVIRLFGLVDVRVCVVRDSMNEERLESFCGRWGSALSSIRNLMRVNAVKCVKLPRERCRCYT
jgi:hypothetical protein